MKYFTSEWWASGCENESVIDKYREYYLSISSKLPDQLRSFEENHTLHDANVTSISTDLVKNEVAINFKGWDRELNYPVNYEIYFVGVKSFNQTSLQEDSEIGDLGYWEYEALDGDIEMRMLFASGAQFNVVFNDFRFSVSPRQLCMGG
ncbi:hypothetical protein [Zooshikella ganghwensis]|uniref:hypothetical protein n=1 Tax=Zooshikella ganghwensis TaxID=202772 RepID=UPI000B9E2D13|nr:hypothetical protein [Zooshikella ganghwensis]